MNSIVAFTSDLFVRSRIVEIANQTGIKAAFAENSGQLKAMVAQNRPQLVIFDLSTTEYDPFSMAKELRTISPVRLFGLYPHVRTDLKARANSAGFEYVVPNSAFVASLRRIMLEEAEDE
jgi:PleD family two-component response regulator